MKSKNKQRDSQEVLVSSKASLRIICKDGRGVPISVSGRVRVQSEAETGRAWMAKGHPGVVSEFRFDLPPGRYVIYVEAKGFKPARDTADVVGGEPTLKDVFLRIADESEKENDHEEGEKHLVDGRFKFFVSLRSPASLLKQGRKEFPAGARAIALRHSRHMITASASGRGIVVRRIDDPVPASSFGSVDAFV